MQRTEFRRHQPHANIKMIPTFLRRFEMIIPRPQSKGGLTVTIAIVWIEVAEPEEFQRAHQAEEQGGE
jgi:hypothetical protein